MEGLRGVTGAQIRCLENSVVKVGPLIPTSAWDPQCSPKSTKECGAIPFSKQRVGETLGLGGDGLSGARAARSRRLSFGFGSSSSSNQNVSLPARRRSSSSAPLARSLHTESPLTDIDSLDLEAETPSLLHQCSDLDWKKLVSDLRSEALDGFESAGLRALSLQAVDVLMKSWAQEQIVHKIDNSTSGYIPTDPGWSFEAAATDLRIEANLQAARALSREVDSNFDWEHDVAELHQRILLQSDAQPSVSMPPQQSMWQAWTRAQGYSFESCNQLAQETLGSTSMGEFGMASETDLRGSVVDRVDKTWTGEAFASKSSLGLGAAIVAGLAAAEGIWLQGAIASGVAMDSPSTVEPASRAPSWLVPAVLLFPPLSYFLFRYYRDKVNPGAKLTDWMFGLVVTVIVSNLLMMATWGVRLY